ncbi:MAG: hypothetical protein OEY56_02100 [Cyclobacteriaceae bacterium]|nr:hypothetical protein [Cyclobacteriaceae bacterium]
MIGKHWIFRIAVILICHHSISLQAQRRIPPAWWIDKHNWDGVTPWYHYMTISTGRLGPNALPVPYVKDGRVHENIEYEFGIQGYFNPHETTLNMYNELYVPIGKNIAVGSYIVPLELFQTDTVLRDLRKSMDHDGRGVSGGDFYLSTYIQILDDQPRLPDVLLSINTKTASGTDLDGARFTETPGYFFDLSFSKTLHGKGKLSAWRPYGMMGFYSWQTFHRTLYQNDALTYGVGSTWLFPNFSLDVNTGGMRGYFDQGDRPIVSRLTLIARKSKPVRYKILYEKGWKDFDFNSIRFSVLLSFSSPMLMTPEEWKKRKL